VALSEIRGQVWELLWRALQPELVEQSGKVLGEGLPLNKNWQQCLAPGVDQALLLEEPGIDVVEESAGPGGHVYQLPALHAEVGLAAQSRRELGPEGEHFTGSCRPLVQRGQSAEPKLRSRDCRAMSGILPALPHDAMSDQQAAPGRGTTWQQGTLDGADAADAGMHHETRQGEGALGTAAGGDSRASSHDLAPMGSSENCAGTLGAGAGSLVWATGRSSSALRGSDAAPTVLCLSCACTRPDWRQNGPVAVMRKVSVRLALVGAGWGASWPVRGS
jgi:hypothetical protein